MVRKEYPQTGLLRERKLYIDVTVTLENTTCVNFLTIEPVREFSSEVVQRFLINPFFKAVNLIFAGIEPNIITFIITNFIRCLIRDNLIFKQWTFSLSK